MRTDVLVVGPGVRRPGGVELLPRNGPWTEEGGSSDRRRTVVSNAGPAGTVPPGRPVTFRRKSSGESEGG